MSPIDGGFLQDEPKKKPAAALKNVSKKDSSSSDDSSDSDSSDEEVSLFVALCGELVMVAVV